MAWTVSGWLPKPCLADSEVWSRRSDPSFAERARAVYPVTVSIRGAQFSRTAQALRPNISPGDFKSPGDHFVASNGVIAGF